MDYDWPGNVRELENVIERATVPVVRSRIGADLVPDHVRSSRSFQMPQFVVPPEGISYRDAEASFQRGLIESALEAAGGVQKKAAELLHIKPTTLNEMIKRYDIRPRRKKAPNGSGAARRAIRRPTGSPSPSSRTAIEGPHPSDLPASSATPSSARR